MATINLPELIVSTFSGGLEVFAHILAVAEDHAKETGIDADIFVDGRLVEDQLPLSFQVQFISRIVQSNLGRLAGENPTPFEDDEKTFEDLQKRIQRTQELVKSFDVTKAQNREGTDFEFNFKSEPRKTTLGSFMLNHVTPNFYFHISTAYAILRAKGVPLGKKDWLGGFLNL